MDCVTYVTMSHWLIWWSSSQRRSPCTSLTCRARQLAGNKCPGRAEGNWWNWLFFCFRWLRFPVGIRVISIRLGSTFHSVPVMSSQFAGDCRTPNMGMGQGWTWLNDVVLVAWSRAKRPSIALVFEWILHLSTDIEQDVKEKTKKLKRHYRNLCFFSIDSVAKDWVAIHVAGKLF